MYILMKHLKDDIFSKIHGNFFGSCSNISLCRLLFISTASTGSGLSSQRTQHSSWSERWSSPRLDYCNSFLAGLPASATKPLQHIQNTAAHLIFNLPKFSHVTPPPPLTSCRSLHPIQDDAASHHDRQRNCTHLPPNTGQTTRSSAGSSLHYISWLAGTAIAESKQRSLSAEVMTLLCSGAPVVEQSPDQCQDSRVTRHLSQKTQDSLVQTSPRSLPIPILQKGYVLTLSA